MTGFCFGCCVGRIKYKASPLNTNMLFGCWCNLSVNIVKTSSIQILCYLELKPCDLEVLRCQEAKAKSAESTQKEAAKTAALEKFQNASASHDKAGGVIPPAVTNCQSLQ